MKQGNVMADVFESEVIQGDTGPIWHVGVPSIDVDGNSSGYELLTNYTCTLVYSDSAGDEQTRAIIDVNSANTEFLVQMTSAETDTLNVGLSQIAIQVKDNSGVPYRSEVQINLTVSTQRYQE